MTQANIDKARQETIAYHEEYYSSHKLFDTDSWLASADKELLKLVDKLALLSKENNGAPLAVLDLGAGVGRNCIPLAQALKSRGVKATIEAVDILPSSVQILKENAHEYSVEDYIQASCQDNDSLRLEKDKYHLLFAISVLEHCRGKDKVQEILTKMASAVRPGGYCQIEITTDRKVTALDNGEDLPTSVETPLTKEEVKDLLDKTFKDFVPEHYTVFAYKEEILRNKRKALWHSQQTSFIASKKSS